MTYAARQGDALGGIPIAASPLSTRQGAAVTSLLMGPHPSSDCGPPLQDEQQIGAGDPEGLQGAHWCRTHLCVEASNEVTKPSQLPLASGIPVFQLVTGSGPFAPQAHKASTVPRELPDICSPFLPSKSRGPSLIGLSSSGEVSTS